MPQVESIVMPSGGFWGGVGEPTIAVAAPAVLNAYFAGYRQAKSVRCRCADQNIRSPDGISGRRFDMGQLMANRPCRLGAACAATAGLYESDRSIAALHARKV